MVSFQDREDSESPGGTGIQQSWAFDKTVEKWRDLVALLMSADDVGREAVARVMAGPEKQLGSVEDVLQCRADYLSGFRDLLLDAVRRPGRYLDRLLCGVEGPLLLYRQWALWCWWAEVLWRAANLPETAVLESDRRDLRLRAARMRFLVLSEPFRHRAQTTDALEWLPGADEPLEGSAPSEQVFGEGSWHVLVDRVREARREWQLILDAYDDHPTLSVLSARDREAEIDRLVFTAGRSSSRLHLGGPHLANPTGGRSDDPSIESRVVERHLLPRFQLCHVVMLSPAGVGGSTAARVTMGLAGVLSLATAIVLVSAAVVDHRTVGSTAAPLRADGLVVAFWAALAVYAVLIVGLLRWGRSFTWPWLLRWPAASAIGMLAVTGLHPDWWTLLPAPSIAFGPLWAPLAMVVIAYGYLVVEVRNHAVDATQALVRAAAVLAVGCGHALLVSVLGLATAVAVFSERPEGGGGPLAMSDSQVLLAVAASTGWCLTVGVFSQILWDDRPITAALSHTRWSRGV
jgi:hypothetical protein